MGKVPENMFTDTDVNSAEPSFNESKYKSTAIPRPTTKCKTRIRTKTNDFIERHNDEFKRLFGRKSGLGKGFSSVNNRMMHKCVCIRPSC